MFFGISTERVDLQPANMPRDRGDEERNSKVVGEDAASRYSPMPSMPSWRRMGHRRDL